MGRAQRTGRGFREVDIAATSVQQGSARFSSWDRRNVAYPIHWRNNLTALSQHANLYFAAFGDEIHVFEPEFPSQKVSRRIFSWKVATSGIKRAPSLPRHRHLINRLLVGGLGTEEVIATAHDEGDFIVCTVRSVCHAIRAARSPNVTFQDAAKRYLCYICKENVGASAWGIALHQNARLLAVSANSRAITVIAPALVSMEDASLCEQERTKDESYQLSGHGDNIPSIAFCNTADDKEGRFLVSTDITGWIFVWDILKRSILKKIGISVGSNDAQLEEERYLGWSVACLDPRVFRSVRTDVELVGFVRPSDERGATTVDVSPARKDLRDFQVTHDSNDDLTQVARGARESNLQSTSPLISEAELDEEENDYEVEYSEDEDDLDLDLDDFDSRDPYGDTSAINDGDIDASSDELYNADDSPFWEDGSFRNEAGANEDSGSDLLEFLPSNESISTNSPPLSVPLPSAPRPIFRTPPRTRPTTMMAALPLTRGPGFPFSILHAGQRIITLLHPPFETAAAVCFDPCHEHLPQMVVPLLHSFERFNMHACISELGIVVLASQKGRAAIFTLTSLPHSAQHCSRENSPSAKRKHRRSSAASIGDHRSPSESLRGDNAVPSRRAMRLDWVIPFKSQERANARPWSPLAGIATAPVQGQSSRRWRLMLTYTDHTVLSYDLFRSEEPDGRLLVI